MKIVQKIKKFFSDQPVDKAWIFGSFSRFEERKNSDLDILVKFSQNKKITLLQYFHLVNELERLTGKKIELVEDGQLKSYAVASAESDKILIYERKT